MKRTAICLFVSIAIGGVFIGGAVEPAFAAAKNDDKGKDAAKDSGDAKPTDEKPPADDIGDLDTTTGAEKPAAVDEAAVRAAATVSWQDIHAVERKPFLKGGRVELAPIVGRSVNDILIRHWLFGLDLNYFLTDVLSVGLQGTYYVKEFTDRGNLIGLQYNRIPTLNRALYGGALNFAYVPVYGKFALVNKWIVGWEIYASAGVGMTRTEIIPRIPGQEVFSTNAITPNAAIGGRFFLFNWLTLNYAVRDYILIDKFEPTDRTPDQTIDVVKANADQRLVHNIVFYLGVGVYLPTKFQYKLPR
jgi:outer membrane beta-barrel protein